MLLTCYLNDLLQTASLTTHTAAVNVDDIEIVDDNAKALPNFQSDSWNKHQRMIPFISSSSSSTTNQRIKRPQRRRQSSRNRWDSMGREPKDLHSTRSSSPTTAATTTKVNRTGASLQKPTMPMRRVSIDKEELSPVSVTTIAEMMDKSYVEYPRDSKPSGFTTLRMPVRRLSVDKEAIADYILGGPVF